MNAITSPSRTGMIRVGVIVLVALGAAGVAAFFSRGHTVGAQETEHADEDQLAITVNAVRPRLDTNSQMTVERPCDVEAYYKAEIEARASGMVKPFRLAVGSKVEKGQVLIRIDVPDLEAAVKEKDNIIGQRKKEVELAEAKVKAADAAVHTAEENVKERIALEKQAEAQTAFRKQQYDRMYKLRLTNAVDQNVVDEALRNWEYAKATVQSSLSGIVKARSEVNDAQANLLVAKADVRQKEQLVHVAEADYERTCALLEYANVKAPFRGEVVQRKVDPGDTVQNATTGHPSPLLTLARLDIVTVVMRLPDNFAPFVTPGTEAILELDSLPGLKIHGKVTRYSRSLETDKHDRTMRIEVDLWNGSAEEFNKFVADNKNLDDLKEGPLPLVPQFSGTDRMKRSTQLMPGMYGQMTLVLRNFGKTYLIPSQALFREGGRAKIYVVKDGKAHRVPVEVPMNDGILAKVEVLDDKDRVVGDLTGSEEVIVSNQEELSEGQPVKATLLPSWKSIEKKKPR